MPRSCCFIGHSRVFGDISRALTAAVERHITEYGVTDFLVGNYGQFDRLAAAAVKEAKARHSGIRLYLMLPYRPELGRPLPGREGYDNFIYPAEMEGVPLKLAIPRLNRIMVEDASYVIAYVMHSCGPFLFSHEKKEMGCEREGICPSGYNRNTGSPLRNVARERPDEGIGPYGLQATLVVGAHSMRPRAANSRPYKGQGRAARLGSRALRGYATQCFLIV